MLDKHKSAGGGARLALSMPCHPNMMKAYMAPKTTTLSAQKSNKLVIWDCDGCLVDSEALLKQAEVDALHEAGFTEVTRDDCNRLFSGYAPEEGAKRFEAEFGKPLPEHFFRDQIANSLQLFRDKLEGLNTNVRIKSN